METHRAIRMARGDLEGPRTHRYDPLAALYSLCSLSACSVLLLHQLLDPIIAIIFTTLDEEYFKIYC